MTRDILLAKFTGLSEQEKLAVLARMASELTIAARDTYVPGTDAVRDPERLRRFNEVLHRVTGQIAKLVNHDTQRYPDDFFVGYLDEAGHELGCHAHLVKAMERALGAAAVR